jgi:hypothetical protein
VLGGLFGAFIGGSAIAREALENVRRRGLSGLLHARIAVPRRIELRRATEARDAFYPPADVAIVKRFAADVSRELHARGLPLECRVVQRRGGLPMRHQGGLAKDPQEKTGALAERAEL